MPVSSASLLAVCTSDLSEAIQDSDGVKKELAEPYADTRLIPILPVDMAEDWT